jgi:aspartate/methionine/tyrosine aminotransferase
VPDRSGPGSFRQSRRLSAVQTPVIPVVGRWIAETPGTISLGQGVVWYGPPPEVIATAQRFGGSALDHRYGPVEGFDFLVDLIEAKLARENGIRVQPDSRVVVTAGGNLAFKNAIVAITDPGDEVVLQTPYYFNHEMAIVMAGATPVTVPTTSQLQLDVDAIASAITSRTRAIVTVSPNNPTGAVYDETSLRAVNELCRDRGIFHIHDEAYEYFTYGVPHFSPGSIEGAGRWTISLYSLSKAYGMASWRIGYMVVPEALYMAVKKAQDTFLICPPVVSQHAAAAALRVGVDYAKAHLPSLERTRKTVREALAGDDVPWDVPEADGAFYLFVRLRSDSDPMRLAEQLIREYKVAVMPGVAFGVQGCALRVSYGALDGATVTEGIGRLVTGLRALVGSGSTVAP